METPLCRFHREWIIAVAAAKRFWIALCQTADDRARGQLRLGVKPGLNRHQVRIELGRHSDPLLITSLGPAMRRARLAWFSRLAERLRKGAGGGQWRQYQVCHSAVDAATIDAVAKFLLCRSDLGQQRNRIEGSVLLAQPPLYG